MEEKIKDYLIISDEDEEEETKNTPTTIACW